VHSACGAATGFDVACHSCGEVVGPRDVRVVPGKGRARAGLVPTRT